MHLFSGSSRLLFTVFPGKVPRLLTQAEGAVRLITI